MKFKFYIIISAGADGGLHSLVSFYFLNQFCSYHRNILTVEGIYLPVNDILSRPYHAQMFSFDKKVILVTLYSMFACTGF